MVNKKINTIEKDFIKQARSSDWCDLAGIIIALEFAINIEGDSKVLELLNLKLDIFEKEKKKRVFNKFDMSFFLKRELEYLTEDTYDFEDF